jgi:hypothetical protein
MSTDRYTSAALWLIFLGLLVIVAVPLVLGRSWHDYFFPTQARDFTEAADEARPVTWMTEDGGFQRTEIERQPVFGRLSALIGFRITATTEMLSDARVSGMRLVVVQEADEGVVVEEVSLGQGSLSKPERVASVSGFIPKPHRGWYLELMTTAWDGYSVEFAYGDVGSRMDR